MKQKTQNKSNLKSEIESIKERNRRVELDKAWETSLTRKIIISVLTYLVIVIFFIYASIERPWLNAIVPALAFLISTLSMPWFKKMWMKDKR